MILPVSARAESPDARVIDTVVKDSLRAWEVPGAAVVIVSDDQVVYAQGFGVKVQGGKDPVTPDTIFALGSCSKAFTTTLMAMVVDDGKLAWDDPVRKHLNYFHLRDTVADSAVTLRDLVTHRTGVGSHDFLWYRSPLSHEERIRKLALLEPAYTFRSGFQYQSTMFTAAGLAAESAAGDKWVDLVQKRVLDPLDMKHVKLTSVAATKTDDHATPHRRNERGSIEAIDWYEMKEPDPAGSVSASARDLGQWMRFHLNHGKMDGKQLVSAKNLDETHTPQNVIRMTPALEAMHPETSLMNYAMGWVVHDYRGQRVVAHAGLIDGFRVQITMVPEKKLGIAVLTNFQDARMTTAVSCTLVDVYLGLKRRNWDEYLLKVVKDEADAQSARRKEKDKQRQPDVKPTRELPAYVGVYEDEAYGKMEIKLQGNALVLKWNSYSPPLNHFKGDAFTVELGSAGISDVEFKLAPKSREVVSFKFAEPVGREFKKVTP